MAERRKPGWAEIPAMVPPPPMDDRSVPALAAILAILGHLSAEDRGRVLRWVVEKYSPKVTMGGGGDEP